MYTDEPSLEQIETGIRAYNEFQRDWARFASDWNKDVLAGRTDPANPNSFTVDEAFVRLQEAQRERERANSIHGRYHGVGPYNKSTRSREVKYSTWSAANQIGSIQDSLRFYIVDKMRTAATSTASADEIS
jgi:hypothetical protein